MKKYKGKYFTWISLVLREVTDICDNHAFKKKNNVRELMADQVLPDLSPPLMHGIMGKHFLPH